MHAVLRGAAAIVLLSASQAWAQRVQFPSMIFQPAAQATPAAAPMTTFDPGVQPAQPTWDPYADPNAPPGLAPGATPYYTPAQPGPGPYPDGSTGVYPPGYQQPATGGFGGVIRLVQDTRVQDTWVYGDHSEDDLDINSIELSSTLAFPFFYNQAPLLVTPGAAVHWWEGPQTVASTGFADLPPRTYDVFVDFAWNPQITDRVHAELGFRPGLFTDFDHTTDDSLRLMGRALAGITFNPTTQFKIGVVYIDRNEVELLPAGGIIYTPNPDTRWEIFFPRPKFAHRINTIGNTNVWGYLAAEYGGGSWTIERPAGSDSFDYNDIRVMLGVETAPETLSGVKGLFEIGYVFDREVVYEDNPPDSFKPDDTFMLRAGFSF